VSNCPLIKLGDAVTFRGGGTPSKDIPEYWSDEIPWATVKDFKGLILSQTQDSISSKGLAASSAKLIPAGHVIIPTRMALGKAAINSIDLAINQDLRALIPKVELDTKYLLHAILGLSDDIERQGSGATVKGITQEKLSRLKIPLPPIPEQRRIAAILDQADALRAKRREALAQLDSLTQSIFIEMFGDPIANPRRWRKALMADVVAKKYGIKAGPFGSSLKKEEYTSKGYRIYGQEQVIAGRFDIGDYYISERKFEQLKSCAVAEGDLLVSLVGSFGKVLIVPSGIEPGIINPRLLKISPSQQFVTSQFLASLLQHHSVQAHFGQVAHGGTMGILNAGLLKQLEVILPPIELQREFAQQLAATEKLGQQHQESAETFNSLFASLQHRAFRGEL
jgi:type I restriction enzyme S subunit